jgi:hypothetical protein
LLIVVTLSLVDGLVANIVPYERDTTVFYFPLMTWVAQRLHQGEFPLWTPQVFGGYPIFADGEIGLAYPPVLLALLALPIDRAFVLLRWLHVVIAALGTLALARTWKLPYSSAALAGVVFTLGNFLPAQIHHENIVRTASWLPVMLALAERALRADRRRVQLRWTLLSAAALGMAGLSLHSQMLAVDLLMLAAYGAFRWAVGPLPLAHSARAWSGRLLAVTRVCAPVVLLGLGLAAVQLVPLIELAGFSSRGAGIPYSESAAYSLTVYGLVQAVFPYVFRGQGNLQWGLWTHWESYIYIGLVPLILAVIALVCVRRREVAGWGTIGGLGLILALGQYSPINLHYLLWLLPGLSGLRAPGRFTLVVDLAGGMLAAYGLTWLQGLGAAQPASSDNRRLRRVLLGMAVATGAILVAIVGLHAALQIWPDGARSAVQAAYLSLARDSYTLTAADVVSGLAWSTDLTNPRVSGALAGLALIVALLWLWQRAGWRSPTPAGATAAAGAGAKSQNVWRWRGWPVLVVGLAAADLLIFAWAIHPREPLAKLAAEPAPVQALDAAPANDAAPTRVLASPVLNQVAADRLAPFGVQEANGYSSLQFTWHRDYLNRVLAVDDQLLDLWSVRYLIEPAKFGALSDYKGVQFLPQQTLLHAPAGSALSEQRFALGGSTSVVELRLVTAMMAAVDVPQGTPVAQIELRNAGDAVVGTAELLAGRDSMEWAHDLSSVRSFVKHDRVETAGVAFEGSVEPRERELSFADLGFDAPIDATSLSVRATLPIGEFALYGAEVIDANGASQQLFGRTQTKYRPVYADNDIRVLENTAAFPRAFIVPSARVAPSHQSGLDEMVHQPFQPDQEVVLSDDATTEVPGFLANRGGRGRATVTGYASDTVRIHTSATADAWLVLSDTFYPGWLASVDGQPAAVLRGDVLFRVVPVPAGEHDVEFRFEPSSVKLGLAISLASLVLLVGLGGLALAGGQRRPGRTTSE